MTLLLHWITTIFDLLFFPIQGMRAIIGLCIVSAVAGCILMKLFYCAMDKSASERVKDKIKAHLLEIVLYQHDIRLSLQALRKILTANMVYLKTTLIPLVVILVPCIIIMGQLYARYGSQPFSSGDTFVLRGYLDDSRYLYDTKLDLSKGLKLDMPALRIAQKREIDWRIKAISKGVQDINIIFPEGKTVMLPVYVDKTKPKIPSGLYKSWIKNILFPGANPLNKDSAIKEITITYPTAQYSFLGWHTSWLVIFCIVSILAGFGLKIIWD